MHPTEPAAPTTPAGTGLAMMTIGLLLSGFVLFAAVQAVTVAPCWAALALPILIAVPIWLAMREAALFNRRALLQGATTAESRVRSLLWQGHVSSALLLVIAIGCAAVLLASASLLSATHWAVLFANLLLLPWLYQGFRRRLQSEKLRPAALDVVTRGWPLLWSNMLLIALAFFVIDFAVTGAPDTRLAHWGSLMEQTFASHSEQTTCPAFGWLIGGLAVLEQFSWHWAQVIIPQLNDLLLQLFAWVLFLLHLGLLALTFTLYVIGIIALLERRSRPVDALLGGGTLAKTFLITILILALPGLYASLKLRDLDLEAFQTLPEPLAERLDPCHPDTEARDALRANLDAELAAEIEVIHQRMARRVDTQVDALFAKLDGGVDDYLDWYFTVAGDYQRLGALIAGDLGKLMSQELEQRVFADTGFHAELQTLHTQVLELADSRLTGFAKGLGQQLSDWQSTSPCRPDLLNLTGVLGLEDGVVRALSAAGIGATTGTTAVAAGVLSKKVAAQVVAKVAGKKSFQLASSVLAKLALKKGTSAGSALALGLGTAAVCAPSGPGLIVCGIGGLVIGVVTTIAADKAFVEIDEALSREEMRADILDALNDARQTTKDSLNAQHETWLLQLGSRFNATLDGSFVPLRDGLR
ncbi:hypothetical protein [Halochromatium roseum]|uniref:hypothetical protein n=1 Tax=Halochromatium roseum TaxID=391920 RepID=UPI0019119316|nr:hypothetical protein [Halochromatium roseum]MBK5938243.1 hypothetical protein [Halochromatium roseum]